MKRTLFILIILISSVNSFGSGIDFKSNLKLEKACELAKKENKLVFIDAYAKWCGPCRYLSNNIFTNDSLGKFYNENFINVKIDMESEVGKLYDEKFNITAYPTMLFINSTGELIKLKVGVYSAEDLLNTANYIVNPESDPFNISLKEFENGTIKKESLAYLGWESFLRKIPFKKYVEQYFKDYPSLDLTNMDDLKMFLIEETTPKKKNFSFWNSNIDSVFNYLPPEAYKQKCIITGKLIIDENASDDKAAILEKITGFLKTFARPCEKLDQIDIVLEVRDYLETVKPSQTND